MPPPNLGKIIDQLPLWPIVAIYLFLALLVAILVRNALRRAIDRAQGRLGPNFQQVLIHSIPRPASAVVFLLAVSEGLRHLPLPSSVETLANHDLPFLIEATGVTVLMRAGLAAITAYGTTFPQLKSTAGMARAITWILGLALIAVLLSAALGISLAPALTALGVGSLSVALALQDTLSNFFAGVYLLLDKPIRPGDFVRLDAANEGYVETIGWRSTHLRTLAPSSIIVPNATLSKSIITNFRLTNPRLTLGTAIDVPVAADPVRVAPLFDDVAKGSADIPGVDASQKPFVRMSIGDRGLTFTVYVTVTPSGDGSLVQDELRKRAIARLRAAGLDVAEVNPFVRTK